MSPTDATPPRALVVGAGAVGARVVRQLHGSGVAALVLDRDDARAQALAGALGPSVTAVASPAALPAAIGRGADVVVLATPSPQAPAARDALESGVDVVATTDTVDDVRELLEMEPLCAERGVRLVVGAGMAPGLSGLLVRYLADRLDEVSEAHVAFHGTGGPACARQHHRALSGLAVGWHDGEWWRRPAGSGRELCWFPEPIGGRDCYRAELADVELLHHVVPTLSRISARMSATRRDRLTAWLPMLSPPHREGGLGALRVEVRGARAGERITHVAGLVERAGVVAGAVAATFAASLLAGALAPPGLVLPGDDTLPTTSLVGDVVARGVRIVEFVGDEPR
jgi:saccharopine dehydrogenase-like NADP-dependent oxidoreductase